MKTWQKFAIGTCLIIWTAWGIKYISFRRYQAYTKAVEESKAIKPRTVEVSKDPDDHVVLKEEHPSSLADEENLKGRTLWVNASGQMEYYPFNGKTVDFSHSTGTLLGAEKIVVKDAVEQVVPQLVRERFPNADAELFLIFVKPDDMANPAKEYVVAVGDREGSGYTVITDQLFFYDDPHGIYSYWGPKVWQAIDAHTAVVGMTEHQLQMSLGQDSTPRTDIMGDRSVEFENQGKPKLVKFENGKAIEIRDVSR